MSSSALTAQTRQDALQAMTDPAGVDVLVVGGGVTGAGIALDAATRGLRTAIIDMQDWAQGTSSRSSKLVHGGLRYLYQLNFALVAESLRERGILLSTTAPHLVSAQPFLWPLKIPVIERCYSAVGVGMYDALAIWGNKGKTVPVQKHLSKKRSLEIFPSLKKDALSGAIRFYDARVDDARLVIDLVRTAQSYGALAASRTQVIDYPKDETGRVTGAKVADLETGQEYFIPARHVINATGVWTEVSEKLAGTDGGLEVLASKGVHIVVPRERIQGEMGIFLRTEKSVLFIIPWDRYWVIGTTDTPWTEDLRRPTATAADIDYLLDHANAVLAEPLTRADIIGVYAGLRPLLQPKTKAGTSSAKVSREHTVAEVAPGLVAIAGGKLTSYRKMAEDAVDFILGDQAKAKPSVTETVPLVGAAGIEAARNHADQTAAEQGWERRRVDHLLGRYGTEISLIIESIAADKEAEKPLDLAKPLTHAPAYLRAEVAFAVTHEGAIHVEDVLNHRIRLSYEQPDRGAAAAVEVAEIMQQLLGWDDGKRDWEVKSYQETAAAEIAAMKEITDADSCQQRMEVPDVINMR